MLVALFGTPSTTHAQASAPADAVLAELELNATANCATRAELVRRILLRSDRIRFVTQTPGSRVLKARITAGAGTGQRATLTLVQPGRGSLSRSVVAKNCEEALDALALIAAVSLDPLASTEPVPEPAPTTSGSGGSGGSSPGGESLPAPNTAATDPGGKSKPTREPQRDLPTPKGEAGTDETEPSNAPTGSTQPRPEPVPVDALPPSPPRVPDVVLGLVGGALFGPAPALMPGASASVGLHWEDADLWAPAIRLLVAHYQRTGLSEVGGTAEFSVTEIGAEACPLRLSRNRLSFRPCFLAVGGRLYASGSETEAEADATRPWWVLGASALLFFEASDQFLFIARFSGGFPLIRDTFEFKPDPFHHVPAITFEASLGVGFRFP